MSTDTVNAPSQCGAWECLPVFVMKGRLALGKIAKLSETGTEKYTECMVSMLVMVVLNVQALR